MDLVLDIDVLSPYLNAEVVNMIRASIIIYYYIYYSTIICLCLADILSSSKTLKGDIKVCELHHGGAVTQHVNVKIFYLGQSSSALLGGV